MKNTFGGWSVLGAVVGAASVGGCSGPSDYTVDDSVVVTSPPVPTNTNAGNELFGGRMVRAKGKVAPVAGGTLAVTKAGFAIAADPDRDTVHVVDLAGLSVKSVPLEEGDEPGRVVEGPKGIAYVAARRGGVVLAVDVNEGTATRIPVCSAPRGLAFDEAASKLFVACRSGVLATIDTATNEVTERFRLDPDLRDVVISGENLTVTRFKSAEVLVVSRAGEVLRRSGIAPTVGAGVTPSVAYRALGLPGGGVLVGHVNSADRTLPSGAGAYYGSFCGGSVADLSVATMQDSTQSGEAKLSTTGLSLIGGASGPLDLGLSRDGSRVAAVAAGNSYSVTGAVAQNLWAGPVVANSAVQFITNCGGGVPSVAPPNGSGPIATHVDGELVAVAFDNQNKWIVQSREPARLVLEGGATVTLASDSRYDTGMAMFHLNTGGGISCTSCHPEAGEDGHTWNFSVGPRRSQSLEGGASTRAPFHWEGDLTTFDSLIDEVMLRRMSLTKTVTADQRGALRDWLDSVPRAITADDLDTEAVERGRTLFESPTTGCATCHGGSDLTDNLAHDVGTGGKFITPSLVGVNIRAPLFHDGCAVNLTARFGPCGGGDAHGTTSQLTRADQADLVAYMQSL